MFFLLALQKAEVCKVLNHYWVRLRPARSFMSDCVKGSLHSVYGYSGLAAVVNAGPSEANSLEFFLQFSVNTEAFTLFSVDQGHPDLSAVVVLPQVLAQAP